MNKLITNRATAILQEPTIQPLHDRILVLRMPPEVKAGLVWIPDVAMENSKRAQVLAVGNEVRGVKRGDIVLVPGAASKYPDWEDREIMLIQEADIGGIFT
jgi:co-chaperonin GroES (HSP10)